MTTPSPPSSPAGPGTSEKDRAAARMLADLKAVRDDASRHEARVALLPGRLRAVYGWDTRVLMSPDGPAAVVYLAAGQVWSALDRERLAAECTGLGLERFIVPPLDGSPCLMAGPRVLVRVAAPVRAPLPGRRRAVRPAGLLAVVLGFLSARRRPC